MSELLLYLQSREGLREDCGEEVGVQREEGRFPAQQRKEERGGLILAAGNFHSKVVSRPITTLAA